MVQPPHPMVDGMEERYYYHGKVSKATREQRDFVNAREREERKAARTDAANTSANTSHANNESEVAR